MVQCPKCGKTVKSNAAFCPTCGATIPPEVEKKPDQRTASAGAKSAYSQQPSKNAGSKKKKKKSVGPLILAAVLVIAAVAAVIILLNGKKKKSAELDAYLASGNEASSLVAVTDGAAVTGSQSDGVSEAAKDNPALVTSQTAPGEVLIPEQEETPLTFKVLQYSPRAARITIGNLVESCSTLDTTNPKYTCSILFKFPEEFTLNGGFQCLTGEGEATPVKTTGTPQLVRDAVGIKGIEAAVAGDDSVTWVLNIGDWTGFYFDQVEYYDVTVTSIADPAQQIHHIYTPAEAKTINYMDGKLKNGSIQVDVPGENQLTIRLTDDLLQTGYMNSPEKGKANPVWEIQLCESSYKWLDIVLDGTHGEAIDQMTVTAKQMFAEDRDKAKAATFEGVTYTVVDNTFVISVQLPEDLQQSIYRMKWMEVSMQDGKVTKKIKLWDDVNS